MFRFSFVCSSLQYICPEENGRFVNGVFIKTIHGDSVEHGAIGSFQRTKIVPKTSENVQLSKILGWDMCPLTVQFLHYAGSGPTNRRITSRNVALQGIVRDSNCSAARLTQGTFDLDHSDKQRARCVRMSHPQSYTLTHEHEATASHDSPKSHDVRESWFAQSVIYKETISEASAQKISTTTTLKQGQKKTLQRINTTPGGVHQP